MAGTDKPLASLVFFRGTAQVRAHQADGDDAFICMLNSSGYVQPDDLDSFGVIARRTQVEFGGWARIWLEAEEAEQAAQAKKSAQAKEGVGDEF